MQFFRAEVRVGLFLFLALLLLLVAAFVIGKVGTWFTPKQTYTVLLPSANLLRTRAQVSYAGSPVGEVSAVRLRSEADRAEQHPGYPVAVTMVLQTDVPLRTEARIELKTDGFIGERYLDIFPGGGDLVPSGGTMLGSIGGVEGLLASFAGVGGGLEDLGRAMRTLLADQDHPSSLPATLASIGHLSEALLPRLSSATAALEDLLQSVKQNVAGTSARADGTLQRFDATIAENREGLKRLVQELHTSVGAARQAIGALNRLVETTQGDVTGVLRSTRATSESLQRSTEALAGRLQQVLTRVDSVVVQNDRNLYATVENLREIAENLKVASQMVRANPAVMLWGARETNANRPDPVPAAHDGAQPLRDRGRIGRYDRAP